MHGKSREREETYESTCKHRYISQCDGIQCQNNFVKPYKDHLNILDVLRANIMFYS